MPENTDMGQDKPTTYVSTRKKKIITAALVFLTITALLAFSSPVREMAGSYRENAVLHRLVRSSGAGVQSINITGWVRVDENKAVAYDPETMANSTAAWLKLPELGRGVERWQNQYARGAKVEGLTASGRAVTVLGQTMEVEKGSKVSHVMVKLDGAESWKTPLYQYKIRKALGLYGQDCRVAVTCAGKIKGELSQKELLACAEKMMEQSGATIQEKTVRDNLVSLTGFSPRFFRGAGYAGKEVNLNVALRVNPAEQATYIYVASPVIFTEY